MTLHYPTGPFGFRLRSHQRVVATFDFVNVRGGIQYRKHRIEPGDDESPKTFRFDQPDGKGGWKPGAGNSRVPYRLDELASAVDGQPIFMTEGEAKADKLAKWNLLATSFKEWRQAEFAHLVRGRKVIVLPDNDEPGRAQAEKVCAEIRQSGGKPIIVELPGLPHKGDIIDWVGSYGDFMKIVTKLDDLGAEEAVADPPQPPRSGFEFVAGSELKYTPPEFLIDGLFETDTMGLVFGDPGSAKSFLSVDIALSVATGTDFHGRAVKQGAVFYIAGEGLNGFGRRIQAWSRHRRASLVGAPFFVSKRSAQFLEQTNAKAVTEAIAELAEHHGTPSLIVIDTLARNFGPGDENSNSEMGKFVAAVDSLRSQFPGCVILIVHHSGHEAKHRARGAIALLGALDCEYRLEKTGDLVTVANTKMKDAPQPPALGFRLDDVEIGNGASSAVLIEVEAPAPTEKLSSRSKLARDTYIAAAIEGSSGEGDVFSGLHVDEWRARFYAQHTADNYDAKRQAFNRARNDLQNDGLISVEDNLYFWNDEAVIEEINCAREGDSSPRL